MLVDIEKAGDGALVPIVRAMAIRESENAVPVLQRGVRASEREGLARVLVWRGVVVLRADVGHARDALERQARERATIRRTRHGKIVDRPIVHVPLAMREIGVLPVSV